MFTANAGVKAKGSIFKIIYRRCVPRLGHNQAIGVMSAERLGARSTQRLTNQLRLALEPECLENPTATCFRQLDLAPFDLWDTPVRRERICPVFDNFGATLAVRITTAGLRRGPNP